MKLVQITIKGSSKQNLLTRVIELKEEEDTKYWVSTITCDPIVCLHEQMPSDCPSTGTN